MVYQCCDCKKVVFQPYDISSRHLYDFNTSTCKCGKVTLEEDNSITRLGDVLLWSPIEDAWLHFTVDQSPHI